MWLKPLQLLNTLWTRLFRFDLNGLQLYTYLVYGRFHHSNPQLTVDSMTICQCTCASNVVLVTWKYCFGIALKRCDNMLYPSLAHTCETFSFVAELNYWSCRFSQQLTPTRVLHCGGHPQYSQVSSSVNASGTAFFTCNTFVKSFTVYKINSIYVIACLERSGYSSIIVPLHCFWHLFIRLSLCCMVMHCPPPPIHTSLKAII